MSILRETRRARGLRRRALALLTMPLLFGSITLATATPAHATNPIPGVDPGFVYDATSQTMYYTAWPGDENDFEIMQARVKSDDPNSPLRIAIDDSNSSHLIGKPTAGPCSNGDLEDGLYSNDITNSNEALVHCDASKVNRIVVYGMDQDDRFTVDDDVGDYTDLPSNINVEMHGGDGDDEFSGGYGNDTVYGDAGDDSYDSNTRQPNHGRDTFDGGDGIDDVSYNQIRDVGVTVSLPAGTEKNSISATQPCDAQHPLNCVVDTLRSVEGVTGTNQSDSITGDNNANEIDGLDGVDLIIGAGGRDSLYGEGGLDWIDARDNPPAADAVIDCGNTVGDLVAVDAGVDFPVNCPKPPAVPGSAVAAGLDPSGNVYLFWKGSDDHLVEMTQTNGKWNAPVHFDGVQSQSFGKMTSQPSVDIHASGEVDIWWRGSDYRLWHAFYSGGNWGGPYITPTGHLGSAPTSGTDASNNEYTFWQGTENTLWNAWYDGAGLHFAHAASPTGGQQLASHPSLIVQPNGLQEVYWQGADSHLYLALCLNGKCTNPSNLTDNPAALLASPPSATRDSTGNEYIFWKGTDGALWTRTHIHGVWSASTRAGFSLGSEPAAFVRATAWQQVFWVGSDSNIYEADYLFTKWFGPYNRGH